MSEERDARTNEPEDVEGQRFFANSDESNPDRAESDVEAHKKSVDRFVERADGEKTVDRFVERADGENDVEGHVRSSK